MRLELVKACHTWAERLATILLASAPFLLALRFDLITHGFETVAFLAFFLILAACLALGELYIRKTPLIFLAGCLVVIGLLQLAGYTFPNLPFGYRTVVAFETREALVFITAVVALAWVMFQRTTHSVRLERVVRYLVISGTVLACFGLLQFFLNSRRALFLFPFPAYRGSPFATFESNNAYAAFAGLINPLALARIYGRYNKVCTSLPEASFGRRLSAFFETGGGVDFLCALVIWLSLIFANARAGVLIGFFTTVLFFLLASLGEKRKVFWGILLLFLLFAALFFVAIGPQIVFRELSTLLNPEDPGIVERWSIIRAATGHFLQHKFFGTGLGTFRFAFRPEKPEEMLSIVNPASAESAALHLLCEAGLAALVLIVGILVWVLSAAIRTLSLRRTQPDSYGLGVGFFCAILSVLLHGLYTVPLQSYTVSVLFCVEMTLWARLLYLARRERVEGRASGWRLSVPRALRGPAAVTLAVFFLIVEGVPIRASAAQFLVRWGEETRRSGPLERARAMDPINPAPPQALGRYYRQVAFQAGRQPNWASERALGYFLEAIHLNPYDPVNYWESGLIFMAAGEFDKAGNIYRLALELNPNSAHSEIYYCAFLLNSLTDARFPRERQRTYIEGAKASLRRYHALKRPYGVDEFERYFRDKAFLYKLNDEVVRDLAAQGKLTAGAP